MGQILSGNGFSVSEDAITEEDVLDLMVEFFKETGMIFAGSKIFEAIGSADEVLAKMKTVVTERWCAHVSFEEQREQLLAVLEHLKFLRQLKGRSSDDVGI